MSATDFVRFSHENSRADFYETTHFLIQRRIKVLRKIKLHLPYLAILANETQPDFNLMGFTEKRLNNFSLKQKKI